jgi:hypothetical protein
MPSLTAHAAPVKPIRRERKPLAPVPVTGSFSGGATTADLLQGVAVLQIDRPEDTNDWYWCAYVVERSRHGLLGWGG